MTSGDIVVVLVDDEPDAMLLLKTLILQNLSIKEVLMADTVDEAVPLIIKFHPDVVFVDVEMPGKSGFELVKELNDLSIETRIVFITAYEKYAIQALRCAAFDFLLKPVNPTELNSTINSLLSSKLNHSIPKKIDELLNLLNQSGKIRINTRNGFSLVEPNEIFFIEADWNYADLHLTDGEKLTSSNNIGIIEKSLPCNQFFRINRSTIINLNFLKQVDRKTNSCLLATSVISKVFAIPRYRIKELDDLLS